jgi:hypothetical protein
VAHTPTCAAPEGFETEAEPRDKQFPKTCIDPANVCARRLQQHVLHIDEFMAEAVATPPDAFDQTASASLHCCDNAGFGGARAPLAIPADVADRAGAAGAVIHVDRHGLRLRRRRQMRGKNGERCNG